MRLADWVSTDLLLLHVKYFKSIVQSDNITECTLGVHAYMDIFKVKGNCMLVHCRLPPSISSGFPGSLPVPIYAPGWRKAL